MGSSQPVAPRHHESVAIRRSQRIHTDPGGGSLLGGGAVAQFGSPVVGRLGSVQGRGGCFACRTSHAIGFEIHPRLLVEKGTVTRSLAIATAARA